VKLLIKIMFGGFVCLSVISISNSCEKYGENGERGGGYSGSVIDSITNSPIDSAKVSLRDTIGAGVFTDSMGYFESAG